MIHRTMKVLIVALIAAFASAVPADAATKKVRHRPKHSTRVSSGATATTGTASTSTHKKTTKTHAATGAKAGSTHTSKSGTAKKSSTKKPLPAAPHKPTTKPH
jgi:hypothetical protein